MGRIVKRIDIAGRKARRLPGTAPLAPAGPLGGKVSTSTAVRPDSAPDATPAASPPAAAAQPAAEGALVLVADDDPVFTDVVAEILADASYRTATVHSGADLARALRERHPDLLLLDYFLPPSNGLELLRAVRKDHPDLPVIILTGGTSEEISVDLMKAGADDYLLKQGLNRELVPTVAQILEHSRRRRRDELYTQLAHLDTQPVTALRTLPLSWIFGPSDAMRQIAAQIEAVANLPTRVLILGETGTGKDLVAKVLHYRSTRFDGPFVPINCAAIPETLLESELFGYERGAFTGADRPRDGLFTVAETGTLLLDEVSEMPSAMQAKLLRVLQEGEVRRVGGRKAHRIDVRVIAASNRNLKADVESGAFRRDLYFRLNVVTIQLPPLRQRLDDLPHLTHFLLHFFSRRFRKLVTDVAPDVFRWFYRYSWPGNVRELEHVIEKGVIFARSAVLRQEDIEFFAERVKTEPVKTRLTDVPFFEAREAFERDYVTRLLQRTGNNLSEASRIAGIGRTTLREKARQLGLID